jgi:hypothetical protein
LGITIGAANDFLADVMANEGAFAIALCCIVMGVGCALFARSRDMQNKRCEIDVVACAAKQKY